MKKNTALLATFALSAFLLVNTGCGKKITGNYNLLETQAGGIQMSTCTTLPTTLNLTENGNTVSGSSSSSCYTQTLTGTDAGNQITGVSLTLTSLTQNQSQYGSTGALPVQPCVFTGILNVNNNQITGTLMLVAQVQTQQTSVPMSSCATSLNISGNLLN